MLKKLLMILGKSDITSDESELLQFVLDLAVDKVKNYCHIEVVPKGLENTVVRIAADFWRAEGYGSEDKPKEVTSVKRGDVSTSFASVSTAEAVQGDFLSKYRAELNSFRKLKR